MKFEASAARCGYKCLAGSKSFLFLPLPTPQAVECARQAMTIGHYQLLVIIIGEYLCKRKLKGALHYSFHAVRFVCMHLHLHTVKDHTQS